MSELKEGRLATGTSPEASAITPRRGNAIKQSFRRSNLCRNIRNYEIRKQWRTTGQYRIDASIVTAQHRMPSGGQTALSLRIGIFDYKLRINSKGGHILAQVSSQSICYHLSGSVIVKN